MMVGPSGSGKSTAWRVLLKALELHEGIEGVAHVIDPKAMTKEALYGVLDPNTREWRDGLFTHVLRRIIDNVRGEINKRQWIIFDGDVDPEWVENLNSVLDNNKLLVIVATKFYTLELFFSAGFPLSRARWVQSIFSSNWPLSTYQQR